MSIISGLRSKINHVTEIAKTAVADHDTAKHRIDICNGCEFLMITRNCKKCGCFVDAKTKLAHARCPINKW